MGGATRDAAAGGGVGAKSRPINSPVAEGCDGRPPVRREAPSAAAVALRPRQKRRCRSALP